MEQAVKVAPSNFGIASTFKALKSPDVAFALMIVMVIFTMVIPMPPFLLDILLSISITLGLLILLISIYVKEPLEFSTFPSILLISTLFRLSLNVSVTRNILLDAPTGHVSKVVMAFGNFVVGGNYFVGFVIFLILVIINFIVITKGAGRVAEVGARFTLDAMPGKQMSIDAELNAGMIDRDEAKRRRKKIEREADFYGSMDGASKFVRGDAIAGIVITGINIVVGLILGVTVHNMSFSQAAQIYTLLTVGDGLVSQIPALIISTASGIIVTRAGDSETLSGSMNEQIASHPRALYVCSGLVFAMALIPGLPAFPFGILGFSLIALGRVASRREDAKIEVAKAKEEGAIAESGKESIEQLLHVDVLALEVGVSLIPLVDGTQDGEVLQRIVSARKQFAQDLGIIVPMVMVRDNIQLKQGEYQILLKGNVIAKGLLYADYSLAMDPGEVMDPIQGIPGKEPAYGLDAIWIRPIHVEEAKFRGYTVVNCATIIVTHLTKMIEENAHNLIGRQEVQNLIEGLKATHPKVADEVIAADRLNLGDVVKVLQNLLEERVSVRDLLSIFETLADHCKSIKHPDVLTRYVRKSLGRGIIKKYQNPDDKILVVTFDRAVEDLMVSSLLHREDGSTSLQLDPEQAQKILNGIAEGMEVFHDKGAQPILLCGSMIRWELKQMIKRFIPGIVILAFDELPQGSMYQVIGQINVQI